MSGIHMYVPQHLWSSVPHGACCDTRHTHAQAGSSQGGPAVASAWSSHYRICYHMLCSDAGVKEGGEGKETNNERKDEGGREGRKRREI